jgi:hypothetical protein
MAEANIGSNSQKWHQPKLANAAKNGTSQNWPMQPKMAETKIGRYSQKWHQTKLANAAKNG